MLFGRHLSKFVRSGLWDTLSVAVNGSPSIHDELSHEVVGETDWNISRLRLSTGSHEEEESSYYATQTGVEGKWKVDLYTFRRAEQPVRSPSRSPTKTLHRKKGRSGLDQRVRWPRSLRLTPSVLNFGGGDLCWTA